MACPDWPPPLPSLPPYPPPCLKKAKSKAPPQVQAKNSSHQEWWDKYLGQTLKRASGDNGRRKSALYELTNRQRRELLCVKIPTKQHRLMWSIPLPDGSYPQNGLPIWERIYLDQKLPMLKAPPNALVFARQQIGKKLWQNAEGQEFILYDPQGYEVQFSYENVHDPHLTNYYQGKEIQGFLVSLGDANADGWGICTLRRFNQYRKYLRRVHISLVHKEMEHQDMLHDEQHRIKMYTQVTKETMEQNEKKAMMDEAGAVIRETLRLQRENRIKRLQKNIRDKDRRVRKLYARRAREQEERIRQGRLLQAEQEMKQKISNEINRKKKIATLRRWHEGDEKRKRIARRTAEERAKQKAEKVRSRWQNKIDTMKKMYASEDDHLALHEDVRRQNVELRICQMEKLKQRQFERFQDLRKRALMRKALQKWHRDERRMGEAIMSTWLEYLESEYDLETEEYRVKKSINSTMAELLSQDMEGPDRFSIIIMARNRIQCEQTIPLQVSFAIEIILETAIEMWAEKRMHCLVETVAKELFEVGRRRMEELKTRSKNVGQTEFSVNYKSKEPKGVIFREDEKADRKETSDPASSRTTLEETEIKRPPSGFSDRGAEAGKEAPASQAVPEVTQGVIVSYVRFGPVDVCRYQGEYDVETELKPVAGRPKTPMPTQKTLCEAGFSEQRLKDILPTFSDGVELKEKGKFRKLFKNVAMHLFKRATIITERAYEPVSRIRAINKLIFLGDIERSNVVKTLCSLIMNKSEKHLYKCEEFEWIAKVLGREAINEVLRPLEFQKLQDDGVARTKIMFYKPKARKK